MQKIIAMQRVNDYCDYNWEHVTQEDAYSSKNSI